jgi:hypothetical protein
MGARLLPELSKQKRRYVWLTSFVQRTANAHVIRASTNILGSSVPHFKYVAGVSAPVLGPSAAAELPQ